MEQAYYISRLRFVFLIMNLKRIIICCCNFAKTIDWLHEYMMHIELINLRNFDWQVFEKLEMHSAEELKAFLSHKNDTFATNIFYYNLFKVSSRFLFSIFWWYNGGNLNEQFKEYNVFWDGQIAISSHIIANMLFTYFEREKKRKNINLQHYSVQSNLDIQSMCSTKNE